MATKFSGANHPSDTDGRAKKPNPKREKTNIRRFIDDELEEATYGKHLSAVYDGHPDPRD